MCLQALKVSYGIIDNYKLHLKCASLKNTNSFQKTPHRACDKIIQITTA